MRQEDIDNWFQYHEPTPTRIFKYSGLRNSAKAFAELFDKSVPDCADKTAAMRHLRETVMAMNLAIACNPEEKEETKPDLITAKLVSYGSASKDKVLARFPKSYVTSSLDSEFPGKVALYTNEGNYFCHASDEQTAWDHMADLIDEGKV